jgi:hypothetical protein
MVTKYQGPCLAIIGNSKAEIDKYLQWFRKTHEGVWKTKKQEWFTESQAEQIDAIFHQNSYFS